MQDRHHEIHKEDVMKIIKSSNVKALFTKAALAGLVAGAAFMAAPQKANAQVAFGIQLGRPGYVARVPVYQQPYVETYNAGYYAAPAPYAYGFDGRRDWDRHEFEERREHEYREHEYREHEYRGGDHDRDHRDWDRR